MFPVSVPNTVVIAHPCTTKGCSNPVSPSIRDRTISIYNHAYCVPCAVSIGVKKQQDKEDEQNALSLECELLAIQESC